MPRLSCAAIALAGLLALTGCSGDDADGTGSPSDATSASLSAVDTLVEAALDQLASGDEAKARATFENVLELDPGNVYAHYNLGLLAQDAGKTAAALRSYDAALDTDPDFTSALYNKAILLETTDLESSVELYRLVVDADPDLAAAHMRLGFALLHLGQDDEAEVQLAAGIELDPSMADVEAPSYE